MNEILKSLHDRKSVRVFTEEPISDTDKTQILEAALAAPSAGCQLLYTILDITDQEKKDRLADLCDHQPFIAKAPMVLIDIVCENAYQEKSSEKIRKMFDSHIGAKTYGDWMEAFWKRKYESDFSREMNRSMDVYLKEFQE